MDIIKLIDAAKAVSKSPSDQQLSFRLGYTGTAVCVWRKGRATPSDESIVKLCELAVLDPLPWLMHLNMLRCEDPARTIYAKHLKMMCQKSP